MQADPPPRKADPAIDNEDDAAAASSAAPTASNPVANTATNVAGNTSVDTAGVDTAGNTALDTDTNAALATAVVEQTAELPIAKVQGEPFTQLPLDLYIPPDALEVFLETFEGPLDLLLYLIRRQNLDILHIPIADITAQYMKYIGLMETMRFELASEYLVMAAMLAEIKSRMLLPRLEELGDDEDDPRAELIRRLQEYERIKKGAVTLDEMPRLERENHLLQVVAPTIEKELPLPDISMKELMKALRDVAERAHLSGHHNIARETLSVRGRMTHVLSALTIGEFCEFSTLFNPEEGRLGIVVTFLAVLELCKDSTIEIVQSEPFAPIYLTPRSASLEGESADLEGAKAKIEYAGEGTGGEASEEASEGAKGATSTAKETADSDNKNGGEPDDEADKPKSSQE